MRQTQSPELKLHLTLATADSLDSQIQFISGNTVLHTLERKWENRLNDFFLMLKGLLNQVWNHPIPIFWRFSLLMQLNCPQCKITAFSQRIKNRTWGYYYSDKNVFWGIFPPNTKWIDLWDALSDNAQSSFGQLCLPSGTLAAYLHTSVFWILYFKTTAK